MNIDKNKITIKAYWYKRNVAKLNQSFNPHNKESINIWVPAFNKQLRFNISISAAT